AYIPQEWKIHRITPMFKSGDRTLVKKYRPISLLCIVSKIVERIVFDKTQFGFLRGWLNPPATIGTFTLHS
uniref:Reverse transcriptase domain-containing protein n=1 Tax=Amphimedon queenslandica TaxID=400682 RepID=A0A1X7TFF9_AMPQE